MAINRIKSGGITDNTIQSGDLAPGTVANDRLANTSITINGTSIALGASGDIVAGTDWQAVTVADGSTQLTAEAGKGYFLDTNAGVIEIKLPSSPTRGDTVILMDYAGTFATNNVFVDTQTENLDSTTTGLYTLSTNDTIAEFVYVDSAKGWVTRINTTTGTTPSGAFNASGTIDGVPPQFTAATGGTVTESGDFKIHSFTGDGCFVVSQVGTSPVYPCSPTAGPDVVDYLVVAGGGGSGDSYNGGGGAGGFRESHSVPVSGCYTASPLATCTGITVTATTYPITVGAGGAAVGATVANPGSNSIFSTITSTGGGDGGVGSGPLTSDYDGGPGGSGGGGAGRGGPGNTGGAGNTPPVSPPQGGSGGSMSNVPSGGGYSAAGGGGATGSGGGGTTPGAPGQNGGNGGAGATTSISGSPTAYAGGGGGFSWGGAGGTGGTGGGGNAGSAGGSGTVSAGSANTGGGAGAGSCSVSSGGKGIVIIRYKFQ